MSFLFKKKALYGLKQRQRALGIEHVVKFLTISNNLSKIVEMFLCTKNQLAKQGLVKGFPKLKYTKDHLCPACQMDKSKKEPHVHKPVPSMNEKLQMLHMDLCGPMRVESINDKRYILVIVDDHFWFTWVKFLRAKDEALEIIIKF
ncbi:retrovirus-related pol polyprotein from transposon TNT 1-94 [Tanacetum coccineum]